MNFFFFRKSHRYWDNVEKYGTATQATGDNVIRRMRITYWIPKATNTHSEYVILIAFALQQRLYQSPSNYYMAFCVSGFHGTAVQLIILYVRAPCSFVHWCRNFVEICFFHSHDWRIRPNLTHASSTVPVYFRIRVLSPLLFLTAMHLYHPVATSQQSLRSAWN
jgi:hypothetical protein